MRLTRDSYRHRRGSRVCTLTLPITEVFPLHRISLFCDVLFVCYIASGGGDPMKAPPMQYGQPQPIPGGAAPYFNPQQPMQYGAPPPNGVFQGQPIAMGVPMNAPPSGQPMYYGAPLMQAVPIQSQYGVPPGGQPYPMRPAAFGGAYGGAYSSGPRPQLVVGQRGWLPPGFWSDGVCDCSGDCGSCCAACWVPPYRWAKTISQLNLMGFGAACVVYFVPWLLTIIAYILSTSSDLGWFLWIAILSHVTLVILSCVFRGRIRYTYQIAGDSCEDCCMSCCCTCCAVAQEGRHVDRDHGLLAPVVVYR